MFYVLIFTEGEHDDTFKFDEFARAEAFRDGVRVGSSKYGGDDCAAFVMPGNEEELDEWAELSGARAAERDRALMKIAEASK